jgi:Leucine-rich repeat (LRR) protein
MSHTSDNEQEDELQRLVVLAKLPEPSPFGAVTLLNLTGCGLKTLPAGFETAFSSLSILFLSNNNFVEMPTVIGACKNLQMVAFKSNGMESIQPEAFQPHLRWLILTDNKIQIIPDTIGRCCKLQKCMLSGNRIQQLPATIANCTQLELIRLASNQLTEPPLALLELPNLAWVGLSDNHCSPCLY